jgi:hypothetical protein
MAGAKHLENESFLFPADVNGGDADLTTVRFISGCLVRRAAKVGWAVHVVGHNLAALADPSDVPGRIADHELVRLDVAGHD